ncbi:MAG: hypothetical protein EAZ53_11495 [Bacteroidetes bacterium]|nr:MAG: hypothetical protein EAZ53_11495 [Bacteroidota bacterium]
MVFCTVITINYTKYAFSLFSSIEKTNQNAIFYLLCIDKRNQILDNACKERNITLIYLDTLDWSSYKSASVYFDSFEFINALKPFFISHLLFNLNHKKVIFLDSDILVTGDFFLVENRLDSYDFSFTPHHNYPLPLDFQISSDLTILQNGFYNGGFYAFRNSDNSKLILDWLQSRMLLYGFKDLKYGMCSDQKLLALAAEVFYKTFYPISDDGYNVAYWNIHERNIFKNENRYFSNNSSLVFFHFSHFYFKNPERLSKWNTRHLCFVENKDLKSLIAEYQSSILQNTILDIEKIPYNYPFSFFNNKKLNEAKRNYFYKNRNLNKSAFYFYCMNLKIQFFKKVSNYIYKQLKLAI